jgi:integrase
VTKDPIRKITTKSGETRYRFIIDVGTKPDGKRDQRCFTFRTYKEAKTERAKIISDRSRGTFVKPTKVTVAEAIDKWLAGRRNLRPSTARNYADSLQLVVDRLGNVHLQDLTKTQLDQLVNELLTSGRRVGNVKKKGLSPRSVNLMLGQLTAVLDDAVRQGTLSRNVAAMVERPRQTKTERKTWTKSQVGTFLEHVALDRLAAAFRLSLYGLRRGEVLGLTWSDIDLEAKTLTIRRARVDVAGKVLEGEPKTERGRRTLPLDDALVTALRSLRDLQEIERIEAGDAYSAACADCGGAHVVVDEIGRPVRPEWYSDRFRKLFQEAGLPVLRLHDARLTSVTIMILQGAPIPVVSAWHGHATASFTMSVYAHSQDDALVVAGETLARAYEPDVKLS